jgi:hypothetical protein
LFKRGIKRDFASFPTLKDDKQNGQWHRTFSNLAWAQDLSDISDENYIPINTADKDLFAEKQKFLYAVLEAKVETAKGKAIMHSHEKDYDVQKAYAELKNYHLTSNTALFSANKTMEYLTSARINDGSWHGSVENFIINWQNQFCLYEQLVPTTSHYKDEQKLAMIQVAVHPLRELHQVKNTALLIKQTNGGKNLTYDEYIQLLSYTASDYDNSQVPAKSRRQLYQSESQDDDFHNYEDNLPDSEPFDIDTPVETIQANTANYRPTPRRAGTDNRV